MTKLNSKPFAAETCSVALHLHASTVNTMVASTKYVDHSFSITGSLKARVILAGSHF